MRVLVACEYSGRVREAFRALGHDAWSADLLPADDNSPFHIEGDIREVLDPTVLKHGKACGYGWDLMIAFPPCTYLCSSGLHWNKRRPGRAEKTEQALRFVQMLMDAPIERIAIENPVGCISTRIRKPSQYIQPYQFGDDASKKTGLWLKGLPLLTPTRQVEPRIVDGKERWANQTDSGQNKLAPSEDRWKVRSQTYQGIADAMAAQWGASKLNRRER